MTLGSAWLQPMVYFEQPNSGVFIGQVTEIPVNTPLYNLTMVGGEKLKEIASLDVTAWAVGDWVYVQKVYGVWKITNPGAATLEDMSDVLRVIMEVRDVESDILLITFDSDDDGDLTVPHIELAPNAYTSFNIYSPAQLGVTPQVDISPGTYSYDLVFYHSATGDFKPVQRQYGRFEIVGGITRRTS